MKQNKKDILDKLKDGDALNINLRTGRIRNLTKDITIESEPFSDVQMEIYQNGGLF